MHACTQTHAHTCRHASHAHAHTDTHTNRQTDRHRQLTGSITVGGVGSGAGSSLTDWAAVLTAVNNMSPTSSEGTIATVVKNNYSY